MGYDEILKNVLAFQKAGFDNACHSAETIQNKTKGWVNEAPYIPESGRNFVLSWLDTVKEARDGLKKYVGDQHTQCEAFLSKSV